MQPVEIKWCENIKTIINNEDRVAFEKKINLKFFKKLPPNIKIVNTNKEYGKK